MLTLNAIKPITLFALIGVAVVLRCGPGHEAGAESLGITEQPGSFTEASGAARIEAVQVTVGGTEGRLEHVMILVFHPLTKAAAEADTRSGISL